MNEYEDTPIISTKRNSIHEYTNTQDIHKPKEICYLYKKKQSVRSVSSFLSAVPGKI